MLHRVLDCRGVGRNLFERPGDKTIKNTSEIFITGLLEEDFLEDLEIRRPTIRPSFILQSSRKKTSGKTNV